ncbi:MAG: anti-sigma factor [Betaproteobacteria bacterium]|nr:MAG: anti-sigma factor [Betaproteobacteria bacterium]
MNCNEAMSLLPVYADGELDPVQSAEIEKHVLGCPDCAARRDELASLRSRIQTEVPYYAAPATLRERVRAAIARGAGLREPVRPPANRWGWLTSGALAGSAATVFAWFIGSAILDWQVGSDLVSEAVANHARATLGNRLTDVASSDQHTVKPWLSARLDYSPPVRDFSADGLPLIGGRLDYAGLQISRAHHRCLRAAGRHRQAGAQIGEPARIQRRARQRRGDGMLGGVRRGAGGARLARHPPYPRSGGIDLPGEVYAFRTGVGGPLHRSLGRSRLRWTPSHLNNNLEEAPCVISSGPR